MHLRNSRKEHGPVKFKPKKTDAKTEASTKITNKQRRARIKELSDAIVYFSCDEKSFTSTELLRRVLRHLYEYPKLARKLYTDDFCIVPVTNRLELATRNLQILLTNVKRHALQLTQPLPKPEQLVDDLYHVIKLMKRYKLTFDQAFDYRLMNIALRIRYASRQGLQHYVPKFYAEMTVEELHNTGKSIGLTPEQITPLLPGLKQKIILGTQRYLLKNGLFASEEEKQSKLAEIDSTVNRNITPKI